MKNILRVSFSLVCGLLMTTQTHAKANNTESLDHIVAIVNDAPITETELNDSINTAKKQIMASGAPAPAESVMHKQVLQQLVDKKLQLQLADQAGLKVDDTQVDKAIGHIAEENKLTSEQLYTQLKKEGLSVAEYRKEIHDEIVIQEVQQQQVGSKIVITPQEVNDFMRSKPGLASNNKEYHLEDILIALPDSPTTQQIQEGKQQAEAVLNKIHQGTRFHDAAMADSSGNKALQGGDLGWRKLSEIPSAFSEKIMQMKPNDIAGPIQTANGFHIIHLAEVRELKTKQVADNRQIEMQLYQRKLEEAVQQWMSKTRSQAFINMNPEG